MGVWGAAILLPLNLKVAEQDLGWLESLNQFSLVCHIDMCMGAVMLRKLEGAILYIKKKLLYTQLCHTMLKQCWHHRGRWLCVPEWEPSNSENQHCLSRTIARMQKGSLSMYSRMMKYSLKTVSPLRLCSTFVFLEKNICFMFQHPQQDYPQG